MSADTVESDTCHRAPQSDKPLEFQGMAQPPSVHSVRAIPLVTAHFGTYLVPTSEPLGRLFTVKDLAARWAVCTATVYSLAKSGRLESLRIGNSIRFMARTVTDYEQSRVGAIAQRQRAPQPMIR